VANSLQDSSGQFTRGCSKEIRYVARINKESRIDMTAKEKARELVVKMQFQKQPLMFDQAKHCALIAVDEIISIVGRYSNYWQEVKHEINQL